MKKILSVIILLVILSAIGYIAYGYYEKATYVAKNPIVTMEVQDYGTIKIELYPDVAPNTVANFTKLIYDGFYNGLTFHRTIPEFMIQGGDPNGDGTSGASIDGIDYSIPGEFAANGIQNGLKHERGVISMARSDYTSVDSTLTSESYDSASSQFFIMTETTKNLNGLYCAFGRVIEGMDVVDKIANTEVISRESAAEGLDTPVNKPIITSMTIDTFGVDYKLPTTVTPFDYSAWQMQQYTNNGNINMDDVIIPE